MAESKIKIDPKNGYSPQTKTYHSLRPAVPLPPPSQPLSIIQCAVALLRSTPAATFLTDPAPAPARHLTYTQFFQKVASLSSSLKPLISQNDVAFVLSPSSIHIPVLYFSLFSLNVVVSPSNPASSPSELTHQIQLSKPAIVFTTSEFVHKIPKTLPVIVLLDSPQFLSMLDSNVSDSNSNDVVVNQSDAAAILYSSGTTGKVKGVVLTHRNLIATITCIYHNAVVEPGVQPVSLFTLPLFHVFGFVMLIRAAALGERVVLMPRFDFVNMLEAVQRYRVTYMPVAPPIVVAMAKSDLVGKYDLRSLQTLSCGGAPLGKEVSERFKGKLPHVEIEQVYGLTECSGGVALSIGPEEASRYGSGGRLTANMEAKIVDLETGMALPPGQRGELWVRGPVIMKGYAGDDAATAATMDSAEGWLKTGDVCYFDSDGFLFIVDRLKELIKYKGYQVPPAELEHLLQSIPELADAAVIPYPDEDAGQIPMAYVVRKPGSSITATQIMDYIAKQVSPYKKIRRVAFVNSIPKSPAGKILRRDLITLALSNNSSKL